MKRHPHILAGTAIGLFMAATPLAAMPLASQPDFTSSPSSQPLLLAQADCAEGAENCVQDQDHSTPEVPAELAPEEAAPQLPEKEQQAEPEILPEPAPVPEAAPAEAEADNPRRKQQKGDKPREKKVPQQAEQPQTQPQAVPEQPAEQPSEKPVEAEPVAPAETPVLDSEKAQPHATENQRPGRDAQRRKQRQPVEAGPPPADDRAAQQAIMPEKIMPIIEEKGTRRERAPDEHRRERPSGTDVLREIGNRVILQLGNQTFVESDERPRMTRNARDVYYEDLSRGRTREVIMRDNGTQIVTIRNRNGDVIQRSRIMPNGREYILNYVDQRYYDDMREWRDPGQDLPPLHLTIPRDDYILESRRVRNPDAYYDFLEQPPVERIERLYSIDEVKRSARVRDIARRIDLDTLNFEFGSASINDSEVEKLDGVATAMERMLAKNPAETFLIEGHTDAVGSDAANLALSDQRAEAVAEALTGAFGIPPENLITQGYGESYLKINTQAPERENRRVTIRRITPLVAPIARAN